MQMMFSRFSCAGAATATVKTHRIDSTRMGSPSRFVARFPLDVATDAGRLLVGRLLAGEHRVEGGTQIGAVVGLTVLGPAGVHLAAIRESAVLAVDEEVG